jgi:hypothetical protein
VEPACYSGPETTPKTKSNNQETSMKKQKAKIAVKDLKARKDVKGGSSHIAGGTHVTGGTKPTGGTSVTGSGSSVTSTSINY